MLEDLGVDFPLVLLLPLPLPLPLGTLYGWSWASDAGRLLGLCGAGLA